MFILFYYLKFKAYFNKIASFENLKLFFNINEFIIQILVYLYKEILNKIKFFKLNI